MGLIRLHGNALQSKQPKSTPADDYDLIHSTCPHGQREAETQSAQTGRSEGDSIAPWGTAVQTGARSGNRWRRLNRTLHLTCYWHWLGSLRTDPPGLSLLCIGQSRPMLWLILFWWREKTGGRAGALGLVDCGWDCNEPPMGRQCAGAIRSFIECPPAGLRAPTRRGGCIYCQPRLQIVSELCKKVILAHERKASAWVGLLCPIKAIKQGESTGSFLFDISYHTCI